MINFVIMILYLGLIVYLGIYFRKENTNVSSFLKARGSLPWLWVGASAYISQFSAWTFTVGAAEAYSNGYNILITFWANAVSFIIAGIYFAKRFRQLRINNSVEAVKLRFGSFNAIILVLVNVPNFLIFPAIWLNSLAVFIGAAMEWNVNTVIIVVGIITILMSVLGGAWAVVSSDFIQMIIITVLSVFCAFFAYTKFQDLGGLLKAIPLTGNFEPKTSSSFLIYFVWVCYMFIQKFAGTNNINNLQRFSTVDSSRNASKAAFFTAGIYIVGTFIWFVPAWFISTQYSDLSILYPNLRRPAQAAYLAFVQNYMPIGILGIVIVALFSATMSSIDSSLNWCSGYVMSILNNNNKKIILGKLLTILFGTIIIILTLYYNTLWNISFFDLTYKLITYVYIPLVIPMLLCIWIKRTPDWSFALSIITGLSLSWWLASNASEFWTPILNRLFQITEVTAKDLTHISQFGTFILQLVITGGIFALSTLFYKEYSKKRARDVAIFYRRLERPVRLNIIRAHTLKPKFTQINNIAWGILLLILEIFILSNNVFLLIVVSFLTILAINFRIGIKSSHKLRTEDGRMGDKGLPQRQ